MPPTSVGGPARSERVAGRPVHWGEHMSKTFTRTQSLKAQKLGSITAIVLALLALSACSPQAAQDNKADSAVISSGIIGGDETPPQAPIASSVVAIYDAFTSQLCTGSLLPNNIVLTAAHCIGTRPEMMVVIFSTRVERNAPMRRVDGVQVSPFWASRQNQMRDTGDIAVVHYQGDTPPGYRPAEWLPDARLLQNKAMVLLAGYGHSDGVGKKGSGILRHTVVRIIQNLFGQTEILLDQTQGTGACQGDSGGPAYLVTGGKAYLWGVTSRGAGDDQNHCNKYAVYTNALAYKGWVEKVSQELIARTAGPDRFGRPRF